MGATQQWLDLFEISEYPDEHMTNLYALNADHIFVFMVVCCVPKHVLSTKFPSEFRR